MDRTLIIVKPDAVARGLLGEILNRFERRGLRLAAGALRSLDEATARAHYAEHDGKPFFPRLVEFITSGPVFVGVLEGTEDVFAVVRTMMGTTNPKESAPGTIRGDLATETGENLIHGSDSLESARREIALFFPDLA
ncbi:MAG: nucleoside-diphosphate kinase [Acidobacteriota bacterium]|nr:nucleoside-diphosphate kinase [Acidobacteriota bacterium]